MAQAQSGDLVRVHYTGRLADGTVFDTSMEREPLEFTLGGGELIAGFEQAVLGMASTLLFSCSESILIWRSRWLRSSLS